MNISINDKSFISVVAKMASRHELITGVTAIGKTVTLKVLAELFSELGILVFMQDIKVDLQTT